MSSCYLPGIFVRVDAGDLCICRGQAGLGVYVHALGAVNFDLVDTDERHHLAEISADEIYRATQRRATGSGSFALCRR